MDTYLAEIRMFGGNYAPRGWMFCKGQMLAIAQYDALFSLLGTTYGGDGQTTFALPDLRGRVPVHPGNGLVLGQLGGVESTTLTVNNIGAHSHPITGTASLPVSSQDGHSAVAKNNFPAVNGDNIYSTTKDGSIMGGLTLNLTTGFAGSANLKPITNMAPILVMNYIICVEGLYPTQN